MLMTASYCHKSGGKKYLYGRVRTPVFCRGHANEQLRNQHVRHLTSEALWHAVCTLILPLLQLIDAPLLPCQQGINGPTALRRDVTRMYMYGIKHSEHGAVYRPPKMRHLHLSRAKSTIKPRGYTCKQSHIEIVM
jgi:hypothetical protein